MQTTILHFILLLLIHQAAADDIDDETEKDEGSGSEIVPEPDFSKFEIDESKYNETCYEYEKIKDSIDVEFLQGILIYVYPSHWGSYTLIISRN